jgi:hypothetical protein
MIDLINFNPWDQKANRVAGKMLSDLHRHRHLARVPYLDTLLAIREFIDQMITLVQAEIVEEVRSKPGQNEEGRVGKPPGPDHV